VVGAFLVLVACFKVDDIKRLSLTPLASPTYPVFAVGVVLILSALVGVGIPALRSGRDPALASTRHITTGTDTVGARIGQNQLSVRFGHLEEIADLANSLVVLPANEFFDDACINDARSALGAFVQSRFPGRTKEFEVAVGSELASLQSQRVVLAGRERNRYGLGTSVYLSHPLNESVHVLVAAATEQLDDGLKGDLKTIFTITRDAYRTAVAHRLPAVNLPLVGAGHGSIKPARALLVQLLAWAEILYRNPDQRMQINIVVFQKDPSSAPEVPRDQVAQLLQTASTLCEP